MEGNDAHRPFNSNLIVERCSISIVNGWMRDLDTSLLRTFVAVAERGSMTAGAAALNVTQGAISQKIARLEDQAGGSLLLRDRRGLGLTPMGERLLGKARRMLALNDEIWTDMQGGSVDGPARLGLPVDLAGPLLVPMLKDFMAAFPRIQPRLSCNSSADIRMRLDEGEFDLALLEEPASDPSGECLTVDRLVWVGIPVPVAVCLLYAAAVSLGWLAVLLARLDTVSGLLLVGFVLAAGVLLLGLLSAVPVYENSRQRQVMLRVVRAHEPEPPAAAAS